jgi:predicted AlkP superfamily phosphohydrolase/phosphomutase
VHNGLAAGGIRLNLIGREPTGILDPRDADAFCDGLRDALLSFVDDETGERVVRSVRRTAEIVTGKHLDALPDLIVDWTDTRKLGTAVLAGGAGSRVRIRSPRTGLIEGTNDYGRTGEHRVEGMFVVAGPGIVSGRVDHMTSVMDFAPTFSALLGVDPSPCDGEPIAALAGIRAPARRS